MQLRFFPGFSVLKGKTGVFFLTFIFLALQPWGQVLNIKNNTIYTLTPYKQLLHDGDKQFSIDQLLNNEQNKFEPNAKASPVLAKGKGYLWCRFSLNNYTNKALYLTISNPFMDAVFL